MPILAYLTNLGMGGGGTVAAPNTDQTIGGGGWQSKHSKHYAEKDIERIVRDKWEAIERAKLDSAEDEKYKPDEHIYDAHDWLSGATKNSAGIFSTGFPNAGAGSASEMERSSLKRRQADEEALIMLLAEIV